MTKVAERLVKASNPQVPTTIYYAFKQSEKAEGGLVSTGWSTFLGALIESGFAVVGT